MESIYYQLICNKVNPLTLKSKILKNKWYHAKVLLKRFQLNGHIIGFRQLTHKLVNRSTLHVSITDSGSQRVIALLFSPKDLTQLQICVAVDFLVC